MEEMIVCVNVELGGTKLQYWLPFKKDAADGDGMPDLTSWKSVDKYLRSELRMHQKYDYELVGEVQRPNSGPKIEVQINNDVSLSVFRRCILLLGAAEIRSLFQIELQLQERVSFKMPKKKEKRSGKHAAVEKKTRDLATKLYGEEAGKQREGDWDEECDYYMAKNPKVLRGFFATRKVISKALGKKAYMINPKRCLCPFVSTKRGSRCKEDSKGTVDLNRLNELGLFVSHLKTRHADNKEAQIAAQRVAKADSFRKVTPEALDELGKIDWNATLTEERKEAGYEEIRPTKDFRDTFDPLFEFGTDAHSQWVRDAIAEFEELDDADE